MHSRHTYFKYKDNDILDDFFFYKYWDNDILDWSRPTLFKLQNSRPKSWLEGNKPYKVNWKKKTIKSNPQTKIFAH